MRDQFNPTQGGNSPEEREGYVENAPLEAAFAAFQGETDEKKRAEAFFRFLHVMAVRIAEDAMVPMPFVDVNGAMFAGLDTANVKVGDTLRLNEEVRLRMDTMRDGAGDEWLPLFLSDRERCKGHTANIIMPVTIVDVLRFGFQWESVSVIILCAILAHIGNKRKKPDPYQEITVLNERGEEVPLLGVDILNERQIGDFTFFRYNVTIKIEGDCYTYPALYKWEKGKPAERISERACPHFEVAHNTVIYLDSTMGDLSHGQLYVARPDGKAERVLEEELYDFSVEDDYIYFVYCYDTVGVGLEGHALHRMDINGDNIITVAYELSGPSLRGGKKFRIEDGWAIYSNYKIQIDDQADGLEKVVLLDNTNEDWIYYTSNRLMKAKPDGNEQVILDDVDTIDYGIVKIEDGWIYYHKGQNMYKIDINGNNKEKIDY